MRPELSTSCKRYKLRINKEEREEDEKNLFSAKNSVKSSHFSTRSHTSWTRTQQLGYTIKLNIHELSIEQRWWCLPSNPRYPSTEFSCMFIESCWLRRNVSVSTPVHCEGFRNLLSVSRENTFNVNDLLQQVHIHSTISPAWNFRYNVIGSLDRPKAEIQQDRFGVWFARFE